MECGLKVLWRVCTPCRFTYKSYLRKLKAPQSHFFDGLRFENSTSQISTTVDNSGLGCRMVWDPRVLEGWVMESQFWLAALCHLTDWWRILLRLGELLGSHFTLTNLESLVSYWTVTLSNWYNIRLSQNIIAIKINCWTLVAASRSNYQEKKIVKKYWKRNYEVDNFRLSS